MNWCVVIAALNTIAIRMELQTSLEIMEARYDLPKVKQVYQKTIFPNDSAKVDAFALIANENGVFLHKVMFTPKSPLSLHLGSS